LDNSVEETKYTQRFILGTELFNPCYDAANDDYVSDFGIFMGEVNDNTASYSNDAYGITSTINVTNDELKIRNKYLNLAENISINDPTVTETNGPYSDFGNPSIVFDDSVNETNTYCSYRKYNKGLQVKSNFEWIILNKDLYPKNLSIKNSFNFTEVQYPDNTELNSESVVNIEP
jgi:hypothetical protein